MSADYPTPPSLPGQVPPQAPYAAPAQYVQPVIDQKSKVAAGLLAIFLGGFGIHNFYLGRVSRGVIQLLITLLSLFFLAWVVWIWSLVEGILILTSQPGIAPWGVDGRNIPLRA